MGVALFFGTSCSVQSAQSLRAQWDLAQRYTEHFQPPSSRANKRIQALCEHPRRGRDELWKKHRHQIVLSSFSVPNLFTAWFLKQSIVRLLSESPRTLHISVGLLQAISGGCFGMNKPQLDELELSEGRWRCRQRVMGKKAAV